jgi:diguanylate cyclase
MSEPGKTETQELKISKNPVIQKRVEEVEKNYIDDTPEIKPIIARKNARKDVAHELKINKIRDEIADEKDKRKVAEKNEAEAKSIAMTDTLTELPNRRWFFTQLEQRIADAVRHDRSLWVTTMDIDLFKLVNDSYGHAVGDEILKLMKQVPARKDEPIARTGGEEFSQIIDGDPTIEGLAKFLGQISKVFTKYSHDVLASSTILADVDPSIAPKRATLSFGLTKFIPGESADNLLRRADTALYRAKEEGRDNGVLAEVDSKGQIIFSKVT